MRPLQLVFPVFVLTGICVTSLAQTAVNANDPNRHPPLSETVKDFDPLISNSEELRRSSMRRQKEAADTGEFLRTISQFREATEDLRTAFGEQNDLKSPMRNLDKLIKPLAEYMKAIKLTSPPVNSADFKDYSQDELERETLTTAERLDNSLQHAEAFLKDAMESETVSIQTMEFLFNIQCDLTRLKWLTGKLTTPRPLSR